MAKKDQSPFKIPLTLSENGALAKLWREFIVDENLYALMSNVKLKKYLDKDLKTISGEVIKPKKKHSIEADIHAGALTFVSLNHLMFQLMECKEIVITMSAVLENNDVKIKSVRIPNPNTVELTSMEEEKNG